ncbi:MAG: acylphosphatase [Candidatus Omnitrophica bacterium]|nr:acylphosphatase [Candidatus Omnitrophota bacterium]
MKRTAAASRRLHVFWSGRVQGVGFRYTAEMAALELKLTGWVRNIPDGRVEAICEGPEAVLKLFLIRIAAGPMKPYIRQSQVEWADATGEFEEFRVRFY